ncbi:MAG TPA: hypothetical protein VIM02_04430 [Rhizomicrobium sp.]
MTEKIETTHVAMDSACIKSLTPQALKIDMGNVQGSQQPKAVPSGNQNTAPQTPPPSKDSTS